MQHPDQELKVLSYVLSNDKTNGQKAGGGGWLRFEKIIELSNLVRLNYTTVEFRLLQRPFSIDSLLDLISLIKGLRQSSNFVKLKNIENIAYDTQKQTTILGYNTKLLKTV